MGPYVFILGKYGRAVGLCVCVFTGIVWVRVCVSLCLCMCVFSPSPDGLHPSCHGALAKRGTQTASLTHGQLNCLLNCPGLQLS